MLAREGDRILVHGRTLGQPDRGGTVLEIRGSPGHTMYRVAWDDGTQSTFMPEGGVAVMASPSEMSKPDEVQGNVKVSVHLSERDDTCEATATLTTLRGTFSASGEAHRHPNDPDVPMIGEELAIGRALAGLAAVLMHEAGEAISDRESRPIHLISL